MSMRFRLVATSLLLAAVSFGAAGQEAAPVVLKEVVTIGTRAADRTITKSAVPVDVITSNAIEEAGLVETWQILQRLVPSLNAPHIPRADDATRPVTLRGMSPGQVLILVNGKRRHSPAVILAGPVLSGTAPNDVGSIPASAIDRIEILRDGAAAQYGSDAIAGVINIILKSGPLREVRVTAGQTYTSEGGRTFHDGKTLNATAAYGFVSGKNGRLTISGLFRDRGPTNRAYPDGRQQYFAGDPRNSNPPVVSSVEGDGETRDLGFLVNSAAPLSREVEVYAFGGMMNRDAGSWSSFRRPVEARNVVRAIHPDGFLPVIDRAIFDYSAAVGTRSTTGRWKWDISSTFGANSARFDIRNSNNVTLGLASPTDFYGGALSAQQWTSNIDVTRSFTRAGRIPVNVALGAEFRRERYEIEAGDSASYIDGGVPILDGDSAGLPGTIGAIANPGFRPEDEVTATRNNIAGYVDLESRVLRGLLFSVAGRAERYSDHGSRSDGKLTARYEPVRGLAFRAAAGSGFRAPSLSQSYLATTSRVLIQVGGKLTAYSIRTLPVHTEAAQLLGAKPLKPETSMNVSAGIVIDLPRIPVVTADFYSVDIADRIVRTGSFRDNSVRLLLEQHGFPDLAGGNYFANAIDTRTRGIDVIAHYAAPMGEYGAIRFVGGFNSTRTRVTHIASLPPDLSRFQSAFSGRMKEGAADARQPDRTVSLSTNYLLKRFGINLHNQRFGQASLLDSSDPAYDQTVRAKWITDLSISYRINRELRIAATAANVFDVYPDEWIDFKDGIDATGQSTAGIFRYPGGISPFGMNGRTLYLHLSYR
jgi:iron complex outermembrane recepter protein